MNRIVKKTFTKEQVEWELKKFYIRDIEEIFFHSKHYKPISFWEWTETDMGFCVTKISDNKYKIEIY